MGTVIFVSFVFYHIIKILDVCCCEQFSLELRSTRGIFPVKTVQSSRNIFWKEMIDFLNVIF